MMFSSVSGGNNVVERVSPFPAVRAGVIEQEGHAGCRNQSRPSLWPLAVRGVSRLERTCLFVVRECVHDLAVTIGASLYAVINPSGRADPPINPWRRGALVRTASVATSAILWVTQGGYSSWVMAPDIGVSRGRFVCPLFQLDRTERGLWLEDCGPTPATEGRTTLSGFWPKSVSPCPYSHTVCAGPCSADKSERGRSADCPQQN